MKPSAILAALLNVALVLGCGPSEPAKTAPPSGPAVDTPKACTQEAKLCPDGTAVSRTGPNCEFAPCPTVDGGTTSTPTPGEGVMCAQDVRECPDGTFVSRVPPSCAFAPCAGAGSTPPQTP